MITIPSPCLGYDLGVSTSCGGAFRDGKQLLLHMSLNFQNFQIDIYYRLYIQNKTITFHIEHASSPDFSVNQGQKADKFTFVLVKFWSRGFTLGDRRNFSFTRKTNNVMLCFNHLLFSAFKIIT